MIVLLYRAEWWLWERSKILVLAFLTYVALC